MPSVLLIGDDTFLAQIMQKKLEADGHEVWHEQCGEDGIVSARTKQPSVIILGLCLPKKNGFEVLEELKQDDRTRTIPVLIYSTLGGREDVVRCLESGADAYLVKGHHSPASVVHQTRRWLKPQPGFTRLQVTIGLAVLFVATVLLFFQFRLYRGRQQALYPPASYIMETTTSASVGDE